MKVNPTHVAQMRQTVDNLIGEGASTDAIVQSIVDVLETPLKRGPKGGPRKSAAVEAKVEEPAL